MKINEKRQCQPHNSSKIVNPLNLGNPSITHKCYPRRLNHISSARKSRPDPHQNPPNQIDSAQNDVDPRKFASILGPNLGLDVSVGADVVGSAREASSVEVILYEGVFLVPPFTEPGVELGVVFEGDVIDAESAPVKVDRLGWTALEVGT